MNSKVLFYFNDNELNPPATDMMIKKAEEDMQIRFPQEFVEFMLTSNGVEGFCGEEYLSIWKIEDISPLNKAYEVNTFSPGLVYFGSDGSSAYAFNYCAKEIPIVKLEFISLGLEEAELYGNDFFTFLDNLYNKHCDSSTQDKPAVNPELQGKIIHEIQPIRLGGSPTDLNNKVALTPYEHSELVVLWQKLLREIAPKT